MCIMTIEVKKNLLLLSLMILMSAPTGPTAAAAVSQAVAPNAASTTAPTLMYNCTIGGQITIIPPSPKIYHRITIRKESNGTLLTEDPAQIGSCEKELSNITGPITLSGCKLGERLHVYIMKEKFQKIYGGKGFHEYIMLCNLPANGTVQKVTAQAVVNKIMSTPPPLIHAPTLALQMTISPSTDVFVGEPLTLKIMLGDSISGSSLYILPHSCSAYSKKAGQNSAIELLSNGRTTDAEIMTDFTVTNGLANATVYAFRFYDSENVTLECFVHICGDKSCNASFQAYASTPPTPSTTTTTTIKQPGGSSNTRRKRRAAQNTSNKKSPLSTRVVKAMFTVKDEEKPTSGQSAVFNSCIVMFIVLQLQRILQQQQ